MGQEPRKDTNGRGEHSRKTLVNLPVLHSCCFVASVPIPYGSVQTSIAVCERDSCPRANAATRALLSAASGKRQKSCVRQRS